MSSFGGKKELSKRDMNFFSEFNASSQKTTKLIAGFVVGALVAVGILVVITVVLLWKLIDVNKDIAYYDEQYKNENYEQLILQSQQLRDNLADSYEYLYALTDLRFKVDSNMGAKDTIIDLINQSIPSDTIVMRYEITGSQVSISAKSYSYYSQVEMVNMLQNSDLFSDVQIVGGREVAETFYDTETGYTSVVMNAFYNYEIVGILDADYVVSVVSLSQSGIALGVQESVMIHSGDIYTVENISTLEQGGITYQLVSISINGISIDTASFDSAFNANSFSFKVTGNCKVQLYYEDAAVLAAQAAAAEAEG